MTGRAPGRTSIGRSLMSLLAAGNGLLVLTLALGFGCYRLVGDPAGRGGGFTLFAGLMVAVSLLWSAILCLLLSRSIRHLISDPLAKLTRSMELVSRSRDYLVRVQGAKDDELGLLFGCFNEMLAEISVRDERLALHSEVLELEVRERTRELSVVNRQLAESLEEVRRAMQAAESANRAKSDFLAQMSHEIRTPMYGVLGMTELLQDSELDGKKLRYLERIRQSGEALLAIINDILDFSKIEAGKMELEAIPFDLWELVGATVEMFSGEAAQKGLELSLKIADRVPRHCKGDPGRLRQVLVNLIGNALKFTPRGSIRVFLQAEGGRLRISVSDTGIGISPEATGRIFNRFSQGEQSTTRRYGGTGLGLAIVRQLTELMGGDLGVASEPGKGSTFCCTVSLEPLPERACTVLRRRALLRGKRVLFASDAVDAGGRVLGRFSEWGVEAEWAADAGAVLNALCAGRFDLVIMDHRLRDTDGIELAATIRSMPAGSSLPLMLLADGECEVQKERARRLGVSLFFKKSQRRHGLYRAVARALGSPPEAGGEGAGPPRPLTWMPGVLLVEDNPINQEIGQALLESLGCRIDLADNGRLALEAVQRKEYDLVLMDCEMPEMDGFETTGRIRNWEREAGGTPGGGRRLPIIAVTAYATRDDRLACLASGADDYLSKPFSREALTRLIDRHLTTAAREAFPMKARGPRAPRGEEVITLDRMSGALDMIRSLPGNRGMEVLRKVIDLYLDSTPSLLQSMREAESGGDAERLKVAAHSFKSSSANLGAMKLADVCQELERLGRAGSTEGALPLLVKVEEEYRLVRDALQGGPLC